MRLWIVERAIDRAQRHAIEASSKMQQQIHASTQRTLAEQQKQRQEPAIDRDLHRLVESVESWGGSSTAESGAVFTLGGGPQVGSLRQRK